MSADYYEILGVARDATPEEIKKAFRKKSKECHADAGGTDDLQRAAKEAYEVLGDPKRRANYDAHGSDFDVDKEAMTTLTSLFDTMLEEEAHELPDPLDECRRLVREKIADLSGKIKRQEQRLGNLQRWERRFKKKKNVERTDLFAPIREMKIAAAQEEIRTVKKWQSVHKRVLELLDDYENGEVPQSLHDRWHRRESSFDESLNFILKGRRR